MNKGLIRFFGSMIVFAILLSFALFLIIHNTESAILVALYGIIVSIMWVVSVLLMILQTIIQRGMNR